MSACPYCNAEIEKDAAACPACGRYLAVEVIERRDEPQQRDAGPGTQRTVYLSRSGCGCCGTRFLVAACIAGGLWFRPLWVVAALLLLLLEISALLRRR